MTTIADVCDRAARWVHWAKPQNWPLELDRLVVANEVGEWLTSCEEWNWLKRPSVLLSLTAAQNYVGLPSDFGRIVSLRTVSGSGVRVLLEDQAAVDEALSMLSSGTSMYRGCLAYSVPTNTQAPQPRLLIGPLPATTVSNCIRLSYIAAWRTCTDETDVVPVPTWFEPLYIRAVAQYLAGWEREKDGDVEARLARLVDDPLYLAAVRRDDNLQADLGPIRNSAEDMIRGGYGENFQSHQTNPSIVTG